jgi:hypothetical protein
MDSQNQPSFVHRDNDDGTIVSFCRRCFLTVGTAMWEASLDEAERVHICDPLRLEHLVQIVESRPAKPE